MISETSGQFSLDSFIEDARKFLPIQFPLGIFIHNNMLLTLEHLQFEDALNQATKIYGAKRTLSEKYYLRKFKQNRISESHLKIGIKDWPGHLNNAIQNNSELHLDFFYHLLINPLELHLDEDFNNIEKIKDDEASWRIWQQSSKFSSSVYHKFQKISVNPRKIKNRKIWKDFLNLNYGERVNDHFHPILIRFLSCYLDQGMALIPNPNKDSGLLKDFLEYLYDNGQLLPEGLSLKKEDFLRLYAYSPEQFVLNEMQAITDLKIPLIGSHSENQSIEEYMRLSLLELRGWAGMINKFEKEPWLVPREKGQMSVLEYLGIYLFLENRTFSYLSKKYKLKTDWPKKSFVSNEAMITLSEKQLTFIVHQICLRYPHFLEKEHDFKVHMIEQVLKFDKTERTIIWQNAFDLTLRDNYLNAIQYARVQKDDQKETTISAQFVFCIDDREESIRRHLEEINKNIRTYSAVGFFGIDMKYKSIFHPHPLNHCPPVVTPSRLIYEKIVDTDKNREKIFGQTNKIMAEMAFMLFYKNRASWYSLILTIVLAPVIGIYLLLRIFKPLSANRLTQYLKIKLMGKLETQLELNKQVDETGQVIGYDFDERAQIVSQILRMCGIIDNFSPFIFIVGHSAKSVNNPYRNAYGCGACSGRAGLPNSKIFCKMANELMVQKILKEKYKIVIPTGTFFVSTCHDTTTDRIVFLNEDEIPSRSLSEFKAIKQDFIQAARINSLERSRIFENKISVNDVVASHAHVSVRASSMAEPRPEYGHTNNLGCFVGRRETIKGLFLDRRSFLTSYDPTQDPSGEVLGMLLGGVIPVVAGINMDYYLSRLDNEKFGSGTKLPLNVTALIGVMTGGCSDLRIGLSKQMVEKHEPVRITVILEANLEIVKKLIVKNPRIKNLILNHWIHVAVFDPAELEYYYLFENDQFVKKLPDKSHAETFKRIKGLSIDIVKNRLGPIPFYFRETNINKESAL